MVESMRKYVRFGGEGIKVKDLIEKLRDYPQDAEVRLTGGIWEYGVYSIFMNEDGSIVFIEADN